MIVCVGEVLVDLIGQNTENGFCYARKIGGAPFNVACCLQKLGTQTAFYGSVGNDSIGRFLIAETKKQGFFESDIKVCDDKRTMFSLVDVGDNGERSFSFCRDNSADAYLPIICDSLIEKATIIHIGSLMISEDYGLNYALDLIDRVHSKGKLVSFDINYRQDLFSNFSSAFERYSSILAKVDIVKFSADEYNLFRHDYVNSLSAKTICVTDGANGSRASYNGKLYVSSSIKICPIDTTGAGDAFFGALLYQIDSALTNRQTFDMDYSLKFASVCGALNTLGIGAIDNLPSKQDIEKYLS